MGFKSALRWMGSGAAALLVSVVGPGWAMAGDIIAPPSLVGTPRSYTAFDSPPIATAPPIHAGPVVSAAVMPFATVTPGCTTCQTKGGLFSKHRPCNGRAMSINPDSCFGFYFTQWSRWEDVCPIPPPPGIPAIPPTPRTPVAPKPADKTSNSDAPLPRPAPMPMPSIPKP